MPLLSAWLLCARACFGVGSVFRVLVDRWMTERPRLFTGTDSRSAVIARGGGL